MVSGTGTIVVNPLGGRPSMDQTCSSTSQRCLIRLRSWEFGGQVNALGSFCVRQAVPEQFLCCVRARCPAGKATAIRKCLCHEGGLLGLKPCLHWWLCLS